MQVKCEKCLRDEKVSNTGLTAGWILDILEKHDEKFREAVGDKKVTKITARDISENKGFASRIFKTNIYVENNPDSVYNFVMKIPTSECMNHVMDETMDKDDKDSIKTIVKHLAAFHAQLYNMEGKWKNRFPFKFIDEDFVSMMDKMNATAIKNHPELAEDLQKLDRIVHDRELLEYMLVGCCKDLGNPAFDMARVITNCTDAEIRRELETFICDFYYENLTKFMADKGKTPSFKLEQFKTAYDYATVNQVTWLPMMTLVFSSNHEVAEDIQEARMKKLELRAKFGLADGVKKLEKLRPDWLPTGGA
uniref:CHK kinase-like domain-containing protein n=1 Tax=Acrobeloides nanus TaxID=290746 RepID=A0A914CIY7_9BILA